MACSPAGESFRVKKTKPGAGKRNSKHLAIAQQLMHGADGQRDPSREFHFQQT